MNEAPPKPRWLVRFHTLPEGVRMVFTAGLGAATGLVTYELLYWINPFHPRATIAWMIAYLIGVTRQHAFHRVLTFTQPTSYWPSLRRAYVMYSGELAFGTGIEWTLTEYFGLNHRIAWFCCLMFTATTSLFFLKRYVFAAPRS